MRVETKCNNHNNKPGLSKRQFEPKIIFFMECSYQYPRIDEVFMEQKRNAVIIIKSRLIKKKKKKKQLDSMNNIF